MMKAQTLLLTLFMVAGLSTTSVLSASSPANISTNQTSKLILCIGDSLTAGYGLLASQAYPALLQKKIKESGLNYEVVNAGVSGDTTAGGLARINWLLKRKPHILILALGANDGLRGLPVQAAKSNLQAIIDRCRSKNPDLKILIAGMQMPSNMGPEYVTNFASIFPELARQNQASLVPFLLDGVAGHTELNQSDQIHPTAEGHKIVAENVWKVLKPILE